MPLRSSAALLTGGPDSSMYRVGGYLMKPTGGHVPVKQTICLLEANHCHLQY